MRALPVITAVLLSAAAHAQEGPCVSGMRWTAGEGDPPAAWYGSCEAEGEARVVLVCLDGQINVTLDIEMPRTEAGEPVAIDFAVDDEIYTVAGTALDTGGGVRPLLRAETAAVEALMAGRSASIAVPDGTLELHLAGSSAAIAPVREACSE